MSVRNERTHPKEHSMPEAELWRAVVKQALDDALGVAKVNSTLEVTRQEGLRDQRRAQTWLLSRSRDFKTVCSLAGLDPDAVYERAVKLSKRGWKLQCAG